MLVGIVHKTENVFIAATLTFTFLALSYFKRFFTIYGRSKSTLSENDLCFFISKPKEPELNETSSSCFKAAFMSV